MGVGKDEGYKQIKEGLGSLHGTKFVIRKSFADPLKISAARALGYQGNEDGCLDLCNRLKKSGNIDVWADGINPMTITGREFLQFYGTEAHRDIFGYGFWVDASLPLDFKHDGKIIIFTDVRFTNEAQRIIDCGGEIWEIVRGDGKTSNHSSEKRLPASLIDRRILNNGTLEEYQSELLTYLEGRSV